MNELKEAFLNLPEVKRIHELEQVLDHNPTLNQMISEMKKIQKQMVNAKEYHQEKQYIEYKKNYDAIYEQILNYPFVEEYLELLEQTNSILENTAFLIQSKINNKLVN